MFFFPRCGNCGADHMRAVSPPKPAAEESTGRSSTLVYLAVGWYDGIEREDVFRRKNDHGASMTYWCCSVSVCTIADCVGGQDSSAHSAAIKTACGI